MIMRIALGIEYQGTHYFGWQRQVSGPTVQSVIEAAITKVANHSVSTYCAGRTDSGVHAFEQVVHFDTFAKRSMDSWLLGINSYLPSDICVRWVVEVSGDFHARFSALKRHYQYVIANTHIQPGLFCQHATWCYRPLDIQLMQEAAQYLIGEHDFSSYRALRCQAHSPVRTIYQLYVEQHNQYVAINVSANGFLHHMVRNIAGVLMAVGAARHKPVWAKHILEARDRTQGGMTADAKGLYFIGVDYSSEFLLPQHKRHFFLK